MWARLVSALVGAWLMAAPAVLGYGAPAAVSDRIAGPLAVSFSIISICQVTRAVRWANLAVGAWIVAAPLVLGYGGAAAASGIVAGALLAGLAFVRGRMDEEFGGGWTSLWQPTTEPGTPGDRPVHPLKRRGR